MFVHEYRGILNYFLFGTNCSLSKLNCMYQQWDYEGELVSMIFLNSHANVFVDAFFTFAGQSLT